MTRLCPKRGSRSNTSGTGLVRSYAASLPVIASCSTCETRCRRASTTFIALGEVGRSTSPSMKDFCTTSNIWRPSRRIFQFVPRTWMTRSRTSPARSWSCRCRTPAAANARWGSLYDALYGTDAIPEDGGATRGSGYNKVRGVRVIARAREILDTVCPLLQGSHKHATAYAIENGQLVIQLGSARAALARPQQFVGFLGEPGAPSAILLRNHGLRLEIRINRSRPVARDDPAGIADVILEAAIA